MTSRRVRDGRVIGYGYDALGRVTSKDVPNIGYFDNDVSYGYDNFGRVTAVHDSAGHQQSFGYDALGRRLSEGSNWYGTSSAVFDLAGRRTRLNWRDGFYVTYEYLTTGEMTAIRENGSFLLASYGYDDRGRRTGISRGNGTSTGYGFDALSRLSSLTQDIGGGSNDQTLGFSYNPASQITQNTRSNDVFAWTNHYNVDRPYAANGLNQYSQTGSIVPTYDGRGNLTSAGSTTYSYTTENRLATGAGTNLAYDGTGRLIHVSISMLDFLYFGSELIQEVQANGGPTLRRYVHGPGTDEPVVWYEGSGTGDRRWLHADERGSVVAVTDGGGNAIAINRYDEYGIPQNTNMGRFQYTGQTWLPELGMYYYKARIYSPTLGRFLQTDPIGYGGGMNMYAYVGGDPVNRVDPTGLDYIELDCSKTSNPKECSKAKNSALAAICSNNPQACTLMAGNPPIIVTGKKPGNDLPPSQTPPTAMIGDTPTGNAGSSGATSQPSDIILPEKCSMAQNAGQWVGEKIGKLGALGTNVGLAGTALGVGATAVGIGVGATGNLPAGLTIAFIGLGVIDISAQVTVYSGLITAGGATISALSGSGKPAIVESLARLSTTVLPSGPIKNFASEAVTKGLNAVVPEVRSCTP